jgi:hypothetical protein
MMLTRFPHSLLRCDDIFDILEASQAVPLFSSGSPYLPGENPGILPFEFLLVLNARRNNRPWRTRKWQTIKAPTSILKA